MKPIFTVRVYGILIENNNLLVSDEIHFGRLITKLPGGGLHFGEGTLDCIQREFMEELQIAVEVTGHFYTTDFFQPSAFDQSMQVISIYYKVSSNDISSIKTVNNKMNIENNGGIMQEFRWVDLSELNGNVFTFPIDKHVARLLTNEVINRKK